MNLIWFNQNSFSIFVAQKQSSNNLKLEIMKTQDLKVESKKVNDQRISLIEKLIKLGFSPEEAKEKVKGKKETI